MDQTYCRYFTRIYANRILRKMRLPIEFKINDNLEERGVIDSDETNQLIYKLILSGKPFFAGRLGGVECAVISDYLVHLKILHKKSVRKKLIDLLHINAGFFPPHKDLVSRFAELTLESVKDVDLIGRWWGDFENFIIEEYAYGATLTDLPSLEPWQEGVKCPWSAALKGKKVLVIHPFEASIQAQYKKQEQIFSGTDILPKFELKTLKAVQTIAGQKDERFETWFDALEYMYNEAMKIDFDIAIIGCGAYGFPLAAKLKKAGKQAIHLGGVTQILFGIKGKRWESEKNFGYLHHYFNDSWIYPLGVDVPQNAKVVEGGCYWK